MVLDDVVKAILQGIALQYLEKRSGKFGTRDFGRDQWVLFKSVEKNGEKHSW